MPFQQPTDNWIGNLECPSTSTEVSQFQQEKHLRFNCRTSYLPHAAKYFDVFSLANNHTDNVNGQVGLDETRVNLDTHNIQHFGHFDNAVKSDICEVVSMKAQVEFSDESNEMSTMPIALCGYHNLYKLPTEEAIAVIEQYSEILPTYIMPHQGREYISRADGLQKKTFRKMIDYGADAVIGGHTHSVIDTELYNGKLIAYSIGNFIFDQQGTEMKRTGMVVHASLNFKLDTIEHLLGKDCSEFQGSCFDTIKETDLPAPLFTTTWDAEISDNSNRLTKKADPTLTQRILKNAKWLQTMNAFNELYN